MTPSSPRTDASDVADATLACAVSCNARHWRRSRHAAQQRPRERKERRDPYEPRQNHAVNLRLRDRLGAEGEAALSRNASSPSFPTAISRHGTRWGRRPRRSDAAPGHNSLRIVPARPISRRGARELQRSAAALAPLEEKVEQALASLEPQE